MSQYFINIGALPNDGTGDPLRTAFNDTNLNFDQIFAAGPVLSNVQITGNKILTLNTNGNLVLAPNGIGRVVSNVSIVPNANVTHDLGSPTQRWRYVYAANLTVTGNFSAGNVFSSAYYYANGDPFIGNGGGNVNFLSVASNIIPAANVTYSLGNATNQWKSLWVSNNTIYINSVPLTVTSGNVLTIGGQNVVTTTSNGVTSLGNIGFVGNAIYDLNGIIIENADLSHGATAALTIPSNGNTTVPISLNNTYGNITLGTGPSSTITSTWTFDTDGNLTLPYNTTIKDTNDGALAIGKFASTGGSSAISIGSFAGNTNQSFDAIAIGSQAGANAQQNGTVAIGSLAGGDQQAAGAIAIGSGAGQIQQGTYAIAIGAGAGSENQPENSIILNANSAGYGLNATNSGLYIDPVRNDTGNTTNAVYFNTATKELTYGPGGVGSYGNSNVANFLANYGSNTISTTGNVTANYFLGNGSQLTGITASANTGNIGFVGDAIYDIHGIILENANLSVGATAALILPSNGNTTIPISLNNTYGNISLGTGPSGTITNTLTFDNAGNLNVPGVIHSVNNIDLYASDAVTINSNNSGATQTWTFDETGTLTVPGLIQGFFGQNLLVSGGQPGIAGSWSIANSQWVTVAASANWALGDSYTIEFFSNATTASGPGNAITVMSQQPDTNLDIYYIDGNLCTNNNTVYCAEPTPGVFTHVAIVSTAGVISIYYNGVAQSLATSAGGSLSNAGAIYIGRRGNNNFQYFQGSLTNIRITNKPVYTGNFSTPTSILTATQSSGANIEAITGTEAQLVLSMPTEVTAYDDTSTWTNAVTNNGTVFEPYSTELATPSGSVQVTAGNYDWTFDTTGAINTPSGGRIASAGMGWMGIDNGDTGNPISINDYYGGDIGNIATSVFLTTDYINLTTDNNGTTNTWVFGADGNLTTPEGAGDITMTGGNITGANAVSANTFVLTTDGNTATITEGTTTVPGGSASTIELAPANPGDANQKLLVYPTVGEGNHLHLTSGNLQVTDIFLGDDSQYIRTSNVGGMVISTNGGEVSGGPVWQFSPSGNTIFPTLTVNLHNGGNQTAQTLQFGNPDYQAVITGPTPTGGASAQRLIIQGQNGGTGEGGDVYLWGGDADTNGGDIKIYAGDADNGAGGYGGYINIDGGRGYNGGGPVEITGGQSTGSQGAPVRIIGGYGQTSGGDANISGGQGGNDNGGNVNVTAGYGANIGGQVNITGGQSALGLPGYGNVNINAGASGWVFDNTGVLTVPGEGQIQSIDDTVTLRSLNTTTGNANSVYLGSSGGFGFFDQEIGGNWLEIFRSGTEPEIRVPQGQGNLYLSTASGNVPYTWNFDSTGALSAPGAITVAGSGGNITGATNIEASGNIVANVFAGTNEYSNPIILAPSLTDYANLKYMQIRAGDDDSHIHYDSGNNAQYDLYYGDDNKYVKVGNTGNITISAYSSGSSQWVFDNTGNLTTSSNTTVTTANATGGGGGHSVTIQAGASDAAIWNSNPGGDLILRGGYGSFGDGGGGPGGNVLIYGGASSDTAPGNIVIDSGGHTWSFENTGELNITDGISALTGIFRNGDDAVGTNDITQVTFGYNDTTTYPQWVVTRHNNGRANNAIDFYTGDGTSAAAFPANAILGGSITQGAMQLAVYANTTVRDSTITSPQPGMMIYVTGTGMQVRGATSWNTVAGSGT